MSSISLHSIHVYPVKSCAGIQLSDAFVEKRGPSHDRRWMLVDASGNFLSQRVLPAMALIKIRLNDSGMIADAPGMDSLPIPLQPESQVLSRVRVWEDSVEAVAYSDKIADWFSRFLGTDCRLVGMPENAERHVDPAFTTTQDPVSFADGYPLLLISTGSLGDLNSRLADPLPMDRFRPNLVVDGCNPFAEDDWKLIQIGSVRFKIAKPCSRCSITTVDQRTGMREEEPLKTLARYRAVEGKINFGQNLIPAVEGRIQVGDTVTIIG